MTLTAATIRKVRALGLSDELFDKVIEIIEEAKAKPPKKEGGADRAARGTRLDPKWVLPMAWGQYALQQGLMEREVREEALNFRDYWVSLSGQNAVKMDWEATWQGWVRRTAKRLGRAPLPSPEAPVAGPAAFSDETWAAIMRRWEITGQWRQDHGPQPGAKGCLVPDKFLRPNRQTLFDADPAPCHR